MIVTAPGPRRPGRAPRTIAAGLIPGRTVHQSAALRAAQFWSSDPNFGTKRAISIKRPGNKNGFPLGKTESSARQPKSINHCISSRRAPAQFQCGSRSKRWVWIRDIPIREESRETKSREVHCGWDMPATCGDPGIVLAAGIEAVIELADSESPVDLPREFRAAPVSAVGRRRIIRTGCCGLAAESVCCSAAGPVCRHWSAVRSGLSRSVCVAAAGIALAEECPMDEILPRVVGSGPADVSPGLFVQFQEALA